ncbi:MAG: insulinase family protein [Clostridia bacterium]|nr:insulinase family protein [Clostridia bacterium]
MQTVNIKNGVNIHFIEGERFKTSLLTFNFSRPLQNPEASYNALIPAVLRRGCNRYPKSSYLNTYLDDLYGASASYAVKKKGANQVVSMRFSTICDSMAPDLKPFSKLCALAKQMIFNPYLPNDEFFDTDYVEREKINLIQFIESVINDKKEYAKKRLIEEMYKDETFGIFEFGSIDDIKKITAKELYEYYKKLLSSSTVDIFVSGKCDKEYITDVIKEAFEEIEVSSSGYTNKPFGKYNEDVKYISETSDITQGKLSIGFKTEVTANHNLYFAMAVFNNLFGGSPHSKLFLNVREKLSLAYYANSGYDGHRGLVIVNCGIEFDKYEITLKEVLKQLDDIKSGSFTDEEISASILAITGSHNAAKDSMSVMEEFCFGGIVSGLNMSLEDSVKKINAVTRQDIIDAAKTVVLDTVFFLKGDE